MVDAQRGGKEHRMLGGVDALGLTDGLCSSHTSHLGKCAWCLGSCLHRSTNMLFSFKPVLIARRLSGK